MTGTASPRPGADGAGEPAGPSPAGGPASPSPAGEPAGYYPQEAYYAPGWTAPVHQPPPPRRRGTRALVALGAVAALALVVGVALGVRFWSDSRPLGDVESTVRATARQLQPGHCVMELPTDGPVGRVTVVPCSAQHDAEVVGVHRLRADDWPGQAAVDREAAAACEMDRAQQAAGFRPVVWAPGRTAWAQGDRAALCLAWYPDGGVRGSWTSGGDVTTP